MTVPASSQRSLKAPEAGTALEDWFKFNYGLEAEGCLSRLNRPFVANSWRGLFRLKAPSDEIFWLAAARVLELALVCAGNYADCCELSAADEMLIGSGRSEVRDRAAEHGVGGNTLQRCMLHVEVLGGGHGSKSAMGPALPPLISLPKTLFASGCFHRTYLDMVRDRCLAARRTVGYFRSQGLTDHKSLCRALARVAPELREQVQGQGCHFNLECFHRMGFELHQLLQGGRIHSRFLCQGSPKPPRTAVSPALSSLLG